MARQLPDEPFAGRGGRASLFLFTRPFLLVPAIVGALLWIAGMLGVGASTGNLDAAGVVILVLLSPVIGLGAAVLTGLPGFMLVRLLRAERPSFDPEPGEIVDREVPANHFVGAEGRGGRLWVTDRRLVFAPHRLNVQLQRIEIELGAIRSVAWRRVIGHAQTQMSQLVEVEHDAGTEILVVNEADRLADRIERLASTHTC